MRGAGVAEKLNCEKGEEDDAEDDNTDDFDKEVNP